MADLEALRAQINDKRAELQSVKDQRSDAQAQAADLQAEKILNDELARINTELNFETNLLKGQQDVIDSMLSAVDSGSTDSSPVVTDIITPPPVVTLPEATVASVVTDENTAEVESN